MYRFPAPIRRHKKLKSVKIPVRIDFQFLMTLVQIQQSTILPLNSIHTFPLDSSHESPHSIQFRKTFKSTKNSQISNARQKVMCSSVHGIFNTREKFFFYKNIFENTSFQPVFHIFSSFSFFLNEFSTSFALNKFPLVEIKLITSQYAKYQTS